MEGPLVTLEFQWRPTPTQVIGSRQDVTRAAIEVGKTAILQVVRRFFEKPQLSWDEAVAGELVAMKVTDPEGHVEQQGQFIVAN